MDFLSWVETSAAIQIVRRKGRIGDQVPIGVVEIAVHDKEQELALTVILTILACVRNSTTVAELSRDVRIGRCG